MPNPSFEEYDECPQWLDDFFVSNWISPTWGSPDYFNLCSEEQLGIPQNVFGWQQPYSGNGYVGVWLSDFTKNEYREYIQCVLLSPLEPLEQYEISFYVSRADSSTKACSNIGLYLSETVVSSESNESLPYTPQVVNSLNSIISDAMSWTHVIDTIVANGGERYVTLGVFTDNANTNWVSTSGGWMSEAYYYIDDVSVKKVNNVEIEEFTKLENGTVSIRVNPNEKVEVNSSELITEYSLYDLSGQLLKYSKISSKEFQIDMYGFMTGVYFLMLDNSNSRTVCKLFKY